MARKDKALIKEVLDNPFRLVTAEELSWIVGKSINFIHAAKNADAPFPGGTTRPEWFLEWLKNNRDFVVKAHARKHASLKVMPDSKRHVS